MLNRQSTLRAVAIAGSIAMVLAAGGAGHAVAGDTPPPPPAGQGTTIPMAVAVKADRLNGTTRLTFDLSRALDAQASLLESPDRVVIDLPQVNFQIDPAAGHRKSEAGGLIKSFRFGMFAPGQSRIIIDLAGPASIVRIGSTSIDGGDPSRLSIELTKSDRATFHRAAQAAAAARAVAEDLAAPAASPPKDGDNRRVVVIDPGHGGIDPGAAGLGGVVEKSITLDFATMLADKLNATGRYKAILTRKDDTFVSLGDRVKVARDANAALFVSIHADTLAANGGVTGATVYTCSDRASDAEAARVAATENDADAAAGVEAAPDASGVNDILFDLTRRETRTYAHLFQRTLVGYWQKIARLNKNPERAAGFKVLQAPDVPSVLLELGYLSSEKDVKAMTSPDWRGQAVGSILASIDAFFAPRQAATSVAGTPMPGPGAAPTN